jgi:hypothetical protein
MSRAAIAVFLLVGAVAAPAVAQGSAASGAQSRPVSVFLDCQADCDDDLIRTEIKWVDWVRDRAVADVHLLVTSQGAGAGGSQYTLAFLGQRAHAGRGDTLSYFSGPTSTSDERRRGVLRVVSLGLVQFAARSPAGASLRVVAPDEEDRAPTSTNPANDPWKAWVFEIDLSGSVNGERTERNREIESGWSASRVTDAWKTNFGLDLSYLDERILVEEFDDSGRVESAETFTNVRRNWSAEGLIVKSVNSRWSAGLQMELESNTSRNMRRSFSIAPAVEFNIYPYAEATRRQLVFRYAIGAAGFLYADTTIFDKIRETLPAHQLIVNYSTRQPWGSTDVSVEHLNYLNDASKRNTNIDGEISIRLFKGFEVEVGGNYSWVRDQLYIRKGRQDVVDVLLRRQELLTGYEYGMRFGISYTFGSIFNNVVNPRF